jgi:hypothetical protein
MLDLIRLSHISKDKHKVIRLKKLHQMEAPLEEREELFMLIGELESEVERQRQRADDAVSKLAHQTEQTDHPHATVQQLSQQAGLIARAVMEADDSRSELQTQQLAKQQLAEELADERMLRQRAEAIVKNLRAEGDNLRAEIDSTRAEMRQLQQQLTSERASHQDNYAMAAELSAAHTDASQRVAVLSTSCAELESQLAVECTRHAQAKTEVETVTASLQAQLATAQTANERLRELADEHQRQTQQLGRECAKLRATEQDLRADRRKLLQEQEAVRIELAEERAAHDATRLTLLGELGELEEEVAAQQPQLERLSLEKARLKARVAALQQQQQLQRLPPQTRDSDGEQTNTTFRSALSRPGDNDVDFSTSPQISPNQRTGGDHRATAAVFERLYRTGRPQHSDTDTASVSGGNGTGPRHLELDLALTNTGLSPARCAMDSASAYGDEYVQHGHQHDATRLIAAQSGSTGSSPGAVSTSGSRATLLYKLRRIGGTEAASKMVRACYI